MQDNPAVQESRSSKGEPVEQTREVLIPAAVMAFAAGVMALKLGTLMTLLDRVSLGVASTM